MTVIELAKSAASQTALAYLDLWFGGEDTFPCGFAWVEVTPKHKGNTREGKAERAALRDMGFTLDHTGKKFSLWNPSGLSVQNMDVKYAGAGAAANVFKEAGLDASANCRLD